MYEVYSQESTSFHEEMNFISLAEINFISRVEIFRYFFSRCEQMLRDICIIYLSVVRNIFNNAFVNEPRYIFGAEVDKHARCNFNLQFVS